MLNFAKKKKKPNTMKKYFATRREAVKAMKERDPQGYMMLQVFKMPKGTRKAGWYKVCDYTDYLNTY